ncbi:hypothetical protein SAMN02910398_02045 [Butyrivibrio sp. YAB3001]|nr:hypothetical protein SAMN02910398_02045 [Butyrivibrio sp. YAB3001]
MKFECDQCGICCQNLRLNKIYARLDRGDGICKYFDEATRLCKVYEHRPLICNVDAMYENCYAEIISRPQYYELNKQACRLLKEKEKI